MKRQPLEWEKIIANEAIDKGLISKVYYTSSISPLTPGSILFTSILFSKKVSSPW